MSACLQICRVFWLDGQRECSSPWHHVKGLTMMQCTYPNARSLNSIVSGWFSISGIIVHFGSVNAWLDSADGNFILEGRGRVGHSGEMPSRMLSAKGVLSSVLGCKIDARILLETIDTWSREYVGRWKWQGVLYSRPGVYEERSSRQPCTAPVYCSTPNCHAHLRG